MPQRTGRLARLVDSTPFDLAMGLVIVVNAVVLALATYPSNRESFGTLLGTLNLACYLVFVAELILRIASYGRHPLAFFRNGWNVFDFIVIVGVLLPVVRTHAQVLRLFRLLRIVRLVRFLPDARMLMATIARAIPALGSIFALMFLIVFIYAMVGYSMFGEALPEAWGTVARAALTLFVLLTLENFPQYLQDAMAVSDWAPIFFLSYVILAAFVIFNLVIGIIVGAMQEARDRARRQSLAYDTSRQAAILRQIGALRQELDGLEDELR